MMQDEFQGETAKLITCTKCGKSFQSTEPFYELILTIKGKKDLYECLDAKFASEKMEGNNQYQCRNCEQLQVKGGGGLIVEISLGIR